VLGLLSLAVLKPRTVKFSRISGKLDGVKYKISDNMQTNLKLRIFPVLITVFFSLNCKSDDEGSNLPTLFAIDQIITEGNQDKKVMLDVRLQAAATKEVTVNYQTLDGAAVAGNDFVATSGSLAFAPGETSQQIEIQLLADTLREEKELFYVQFSNVVNASLSETSATITIENDDTALDLPDEGYSTPTSYPGFTLEWSDEFSGAQVNTADWGFDLGDGCPNVCGWGNNELEWYTNTKNNVFVTDGKLVIEAQKENAGGKNYTSTRMKTQGKRNFQYGRIDIRAKLPIGKGIWPALWMLGEDITTVGWPACGEIDIMEYLGHNPDRVYGTGHWGSSFAAHQYQSDSITVSGNLFSKEFNVFSVVWEQDKITWLMNDQPYHELTPATTGLPDYAFNKPFFFIFNVAVGGNWPGNPDATTTFPQRMIVDYVRVFKKD
jgi:beta-glucanase (GH16 family)